jgi:ADP-ribose pyrophosphatase YjhB (NUDIX family)
MKLNARAIVVNDHKLLLMKRNRLGNEYYSLVGGDVDPGEKPADAVIREVSEETSLIVSNPKLVIIEDARPKLSIQYYIFVCDYESGEIALRADSPEAKINVEGQNSFEPQWVEVGEVANLRLLPTELRDLVLKYIHEGFPDQPFELKIDNIQTS